MKLQFEKVNQTHIKTIFDWLAESFVQEFWDNSQGHKDDIINFVNGRNEPSSYANGEYVYWVASIGNKPYALIMSIQEIKGRKRPAIKEKYLSQAGSTYSLEYMIGNKEFFGKGLGAQTLIEFTVFFKKAVDPNVDTFFIDPDETNPRAKHVYEKAGFEHVGDFIMEGSGVFAGRRTHFLVKKM